VHAVLAVHRPRRCRPHREIALQQHRIHACIRCNATTMHFQNGPAGEFQPRQTDFWRIPASVVEFQ
jgi:hypothetical protein